MREIYIEINFASGEIRLIQGRGITIQASHVTHDTQNWCFQGVCIYREGILGVYGFQ